MTRSATPQTPPDDVVIWHDVECGAYTADLPLWRELAGEHPGPILDVGAGTGRVALALARDGHRVTALDRDTALLAELARRADGLAVETAVADARSFQLAVRFGLILIPMQTIQLLGDEVGRGGLLRCARSHLDPGGRLAIAITEALETYETGDGLLSALPDMAERDGVVYSSMPTAIRELRASFVLERRRERITSDGARTASIDTVLLARLNAAGLEDEGRRAGLVPAGRRTIEPTIDHVGSTVVILGA